MSKRYFLPCSCGGQTTIDIGQAGQIVDCESCGKSLDVPTMRGIRELKSTEVESKVDKIDVAGSAQNFLFVVGLAVTVIALVVCAIVIWQRAQIAKLAVKPAVQKNASFEAGVDSWTAEFTLDWWKENVEGEPLGYYEKRPHEIALERLHVWTIILGVAGAVVLCGLGMVVAAVMMKSGVKSPTKA